MTARCAILDLRLCKKVNIGNMLTADFEVEENIISFSVT